MKKVELRFNTAPIKTGELFIDGQFIDTITVDSDDYWYGANFKGFEFDLNVYTDEGKITAWIYPVTKGKTDTQNGKEVKIIQNTMTIDID